jgi:hypothetical protein
MNTADKVADAVIADRVRVRLWEALDEVSGVCGAICCDCVRFVLSGRCVWCMCVCVICGLCACVCVCVLHVCVACL